MKLSIPRLLFFVAFACFLIAALSAASVLPLAAVPWFYGGFASVALAWAAA